MKKQNLFGDIYECTIERHPYHEEIDIDSTLQDNELKIFFIFDRHIYTKNGEIEFESDFYDKTYSITFRKNPLQCFHQHAMRLMSLHTVIIEEVLPFVAIGLWKDTKITYPMMNYQMKSLQYDEFWLFENKDRWDYLVNDLDILDKNIKIHSPFQKALIWYTMAKLSNTHLETFMNLYRSIETLSNEFHQNTEKELNSFIETKLKMFDRKKMRRIFKIPPEQKIKSYLKSECIPDKKIAKIIKFRNKIAHGEDYSLEFNNNLKILIDEMFEIITILINRKIKLMKINDLKKPSYLINYATILIKFSERKIALIDFDNIDCYPDDWNYYGILRYVNDTEKLIKSIQSVMNEKNINDNKICNKLVQNFGKILNY